MTTVRNSRKLFSQAGHLSPDSFVRWSLEPIIQVIGALGNGDDGFDMMLLAPAGTNFRVLQQYQEHSYSLSPHPSIHWSSHAAISLMFFLLRLRNSQDVPFRSSDKKVPPIVP